MITEGNLTARPREINCILLLAVTALLSIPLATNPGEAWGEFTDVLLKAILIFIVFVNVIRTESRFKLIIWLAFAVSIYLSVYAVSDYMNGVFREGTAANNNQRIGGAITRTIRKLKRPRSASRNDGASRYRICVCFKRRDTEGFVYRSWSAVCRGDRRHVFARRLFRSDDRNARPRAKDGTT